MNDTLKNNNSKKNIIIVVCMILLIAMVIIVALLVTRKPKENEQNGETKRNVVVNEQNVDEIVSELNQNETTPIGYYEVTMNSTWNFEDGAAVSDNAYVENVKTNTNDVYFDLVRTDTNETILASPVIPVGAHLEKISLDKSLPAGTYDCVCTYHLVDENQKTLSTVSVSVKVVINK